MAVGTTLQSATMALILTAAATSSKPKLLDQVGDTIRLKHYSIRTEQAYTDWT